MTQHNTDWYLTEISRRSTKFGSRLGEMMNRYDVTCLKDITLDQAKEYYDYLVANNIDDNKNI